jgi:hypothetical protein
MSALTIESDHLASKQFNGSEGKGEAKAIDRTTEVTG